VPLFIPADCSCSPRIAADSGFAASTFSIAETDVRRGGCRRPVTRARNSGGVIVAHERRLFEASARTSFSGGLRSPPRVEPTGGRYGLQVMCEAGGLANAMVIEAL
jgi:hypothetical protein